MGFAALVFALITSSSPHRLGDGDPACSRISRRARSARVKEIVVHPDQWDCARVRLVGVAVRGFENSNIYDPSVDRCGGRARAIAVDWSSSSIEEARFERLAEVEGTFRNNYGRVWKSGEIIVSHSASGPGPLVDVRVVRWLSGNLPPCPRS
jgi:hypothetical protein